MNKGFHVFGMGLVVKDKPIDTNIIYAYLTDILYNSNGDLSNIENNVITNTDTKNKIESVKLENRTSITARWLALGSSNKLSSPDVRVGEKVLIYRYGNNDDYYWEVYGDNSTLRGKETVTFAFKNTDDLNININEDNSYFIKISTKDKKIYLHTSDNDNELTTYDIELDTKNGEFTLIDGRKNFFNLKSSIDKWTISSNDSIDLISKKVNISASEKLFVDSPESTFTEHVTLKDMTSETVPSYNEHKHPESIGSNTGKPY